MTTTFEKGKQVLARLEELAKKAEAHNKKEEQVRGFKRAKVEQILGQVEQLNALGVELEVELVNETTFSPAFLVKVSEVTEGILAESQAQADRLDEFFDAVENNDEDVLRQYVEGDLGSENLGVTVSSVKELQKTVKANEELIHAKGLDDVEASDSTGVVEPVESEEVAEDTTPVEETGIVGLDLESLGQDLMGDEDEYEDEFEDGGVTDELDTELDAASALFNGFD